MSYLFASDVHLSSARPEMVTRFMDFLSGPCTRARGLYLLGDIFDAWLGDDDTRAPHPQVEHALCALVDRGVPVWLMHGNHDFLMGEALCARTGCRLLADPARIELDGEAVVLMHGDTLCTRDLAYQDFRNQVRDPQNQARFLAQPLAQRAATAASLRAQSSAATVLKADDIMDVSEDAVCDAMRRQQAYTLIHGHTHRPDVHHFDLDGVLARRFVLGDWYEQEKVLVWRGDDRSLLSIEELEEL